MPREKRGKSIGRLTLLSLLVPFLLGFSVVSAFSAPADVASLLQQAQASAAQLRRDATQMETFARSNPSWQSHAHQIDLIKGHINKSGQILAQLHDARSDASHWQQDAIDRITPLLQEMASNTTSVINHLNEHQGRTWTPDYQTYVRENATLAAELSSVISDFVAYDNTKDRIEKLEQKLGFGAP